MKKTKKKPAKKKTTKLSKKAQAYIKMIDKQRAQVAKERLERLEKMGDTPERWILELLGHRGAMISFSKSFYHDKYPDHIVIFNSNLVIQDKLTGVFSKVWYGDVDITVSYKNLRALAMKLGTTIYLLRESDGRFENEEQPQVRRAVYTTDGVSDAYRGTYYDVKMVRGVPKLDRTSSGKIEL